MNLDQRFGTILSIVLHLAILTVTAFIFRNPLSSQIVAAGEGQGNGESAIEVGLVDATHLGFALPRTVSFIGNESGVSNNQILEAKKRTEEEAEILPAENVKRPREQDRTVMTDRPIANQNEQMVAKKPLQGGSANTSIEVGRSFGSSVPSMTGGIGVGPGAGTSSGATGVPGGSEYGRRIQMILSRNYNPPAIGDVGDTQYVVVQMRIARDGRILSLENGRLSTAYVKKRSRNDLINFAAERAIIASSPLPPFPNGFLIGAQEAIAEIWFRYPK